MVAAVALGALLAAGCALAALFELQGVPVPLGLWRLLLPDTAPAMKVLVMVAVALVVLGLLGVAAAG